jgi:hypothetical protein
MRCSVFVTLMLTFFLCGTVCAMTTQEQQRVDVNGQVREFQEKMLGDTDIMALILALQNDPEMQMLLNDPAVLNAVASGNINALTGNPRFMQLLNNPRIREIQQRIEKKIK